MTDNDKSHYYRRFRQAKTETTLEHMFERALSKAASTHEKACIILAHEKRYEELRNPFPGVNKSFF